ncbi:activating transcription factor 7-interacting protein 2 [Protobothrops mucrosquamatus]|uniref:activating transcription factor 7-interacting protein 2 n=1 Tax=Protobothrops mucrosquamatus TaxID=103944 RepID=UPI0010FB80B5|nr:activating transcription factor 7-interacting protein 2 [Protobothrops mucrosquamatus]
MFEKKQLRNGRVSEWTRVSKLSNKSLAAHPPKAAAGYADPPGEQVPPRFPHLPPLPSVEPDPAHSKDLRDTLPPQKLELVVAQVNQPKGIALQWNISRVDPRCAPIESFSLFICLEDLGSGTTSEWRRTSVLKALPLPMACSLSQFPRPARCYFTMQSKDIHGRYGPFCEVQSISAL